MGLRCILGHDFSEPQVEREREEDGNEVVITVQEVKTCDRCEERQIVSENKEVTSIEQLANAADGTAADAADGTAADTTAADGDDGFLANATSEVESVASDESTADESESTAVGPKSTAGQTDAEVSTGDDADDGAIIIDDADDDGPATQTATEAEAESGFDSTESSSATADAAGDPAVDDVDGDADESDGAVIIDDEGDTPDLGDAETTVAEGSDQDDDADSNATDADADADEGVILDEEATAHESDRSHGEWPDHEERDVDAGDHEPWPDQQGTDEGYDAEISDEEANVSFGGGLTPERAADDDVADASDAAGADDGEAEFIEGADAPSDEAADPDDAEPAAIDADESADETTDASSDITRAESPSLSTRMEDSVTEFYCPACEMIRAAGGSSMRAGDICPECHKGYVTERER